VIDPAELIVAGAQSPFPKGSDATAYADGASRGNPGPAAYGVAYTLADGTPLAREAAAIGEATNNVAEYRGLLAALERLRQWGVRRATLRLDSELVVRQMQGRYKVKNEGLKPLHARARQLTAAFSHLNFEHVPREQNRIADKLANLALDAAGQAPTP
jgi:probable phosphoglycerate mutase